MQNNPYENIHSSMENPPTLKTPIKDIPEAVFSTGKKSYQLLPKLELQQKEFFIARQRSLELA